MTTVLEMTGVTRTFGRYVGVLDVNLRLGPGVYGLLGPNGAGKTTFMRLAAGLIRPTSGKLTWLDGKPRRHRALDNEVAICVDGEPLPGRSTPLRLLSFLLRCSGMTQVDAQDHAEATLCELGLEEQLDRPIGRLSRGQKQRVKLAQALALPAKLLLLDEPLNGLDPVWRMRVTDKIEQAAAEGACVVMSSHVLAELETVVDRMVLLFKGRIVAAGTREEIYDLVAHRGVGLTITCDQPRLLAGALLQASAVGATRVEDDTLHVQALDMQALCKALPAAVLQSSVQVSKVSPQGDDLVGMFAALSEQMR